MLRPLRVGTGYSLGCKKVVPEHFTLWQLASDTVALRYNDSGVLIAIRVDELNEKAILSEIERTTGSLAHINYQQPPQTRSSAQPRRAQTGHNFRSWSPPARTF